MNNNTNKKPKKIFILTIVVGLFAAGFSVVALLGIIGILDGWTYSLIIPGIILFIVEIKLSGGLSSGIESTSREYLISQKLIKRSYPGYSFLMKKTEELERGNYYLAASEASLIIIKFDKVNKIVKRIDYKKIKNFKMASKGRTTRFYLELNDGKKYKLFKSESKKILLKLTSFVNLFSFLEKKIEIEGFK